MGDVQGDGFEIETLIHVRVAKAGLVVAEVPSYEHSRIHGVSNLKAHRDGLRVLRTILKERHATHPCAVVPGTTSPQTPNAREQPTAVPEETGLLSPPLASKLEHNDLGLNETSIGDVGVGIPNQSKV